jgi:hypothetical protein
MNTHNIENILIFDIHADFAVHKLVDLCSSPENYELWQNSLQLCTNATMYHEIVPKPIDRLRHSDDMPVDAK